MDVWLSTARCVPKFPLAVGGAPVLALRHEVDVSELVALLEPLP